MRASAFKESQENKDALTRIVRARWSNIVKGLCALGLPIPKKPAAPHRKRS